MPSGEPYDRETQVMTDAYVRVQLKNRVLERLLHIFSDLSRPSWVFDEILGAALDAVPAEAGSLLLTEPDGSLAFVAARGPAADKVLGMTLAPGLGLAGACVQDRRTIAVSDVRGDPRHAREIAQAVGYEAHSLLATPLLHKGEVLGVLEILNKYHSSVFLRSEIEMLERVARAGASAIALLGGRR